MNCNRLLSNRMFRGILLLLILSVNCKAFSRSVQSVTILQPNGGEVWAAGSEREIVWLTNTIDTVVAIEWSQDGGANYELVATEIPNTGLYIWTLPYTSSTQCLVRISSVQNPDSNDISDDFFTISLVDQGAIMVTNTQDDGEGSLRAAIQKANQIPGPNHIDFSIPTNDPGYDTDLGSFVIAVNSQLDAIRDDSLVINGRSQQIFMGLGENIHEPKIQIDGKNSGEFTIGLYVFANQVELHDLIITNFSSDGISLYGTHHVLISGCYIGVGPGGKDRESNYVGVHLFGGGHENMIAGLPGHPNIIGGNENVGLFIQDTSHHNIIHGNLIGVGKDTLGLVGNDLAGIAIQESSDYNAIVGNIIGGNRRGIQITGGNHNEIIENQIGTIHDFGRNFSNSEHGIYILTSTNNLILENTIGFNGKTGIYIYGDHALYNRISANRIALNQEEGISCINGGNNELTPPSISKFENSILRGIATEGQIIEIFFDTLDQGLIFHGSYPIQENGFFEVLIEDPALIQYQVTTTAIDSLGNTSEFSTPFQLTTAVKDRKVDLFDLHVFPNPFTQTIYVNYRLEHNEHVRLEIFDGFGKSRLILYEGDQSPGQYITSWNSRNQAEIIPYNGLYYLRFTTKEINRVIKMILVNP